MYARIDLPGMVNGFHCFGNWFHGIGNWFHGIVNRYHGIGNSLPGTNVYTNGMLMHKLRVYTYWNVIGSALRR